MLATILVLLLLDYLLYPLLAGAGPPSANRGENGLWLRYPWYFGRHSAAETVALAERLQSLQIRCAYFHVRHVTRDGSLRYHYPEQARRLTATLRQHAPDVKVMAWIYAGNLRRAPGLAEVDLANPTVRGKMAEEARWLVQECGFDGVQWDYEICPDWDPYLPQLLRETRQTMGPGKRLSVATPLWLPAPLTARWGWSSSYFGRIAMECDDLAVMGYDSAMYLPRAYTWLMRKQVIEATRAVAKGNPTCRVLIGVPTYAKGGLSHHAWSENLALALKGVREGCAAPQADLSVFAGVAPFADYTTQPEEWQIYRERWLHPGQNQ